MALFPLPPARLAAVLQAVAVLGVLSALVGAVSAWVLLGRTGAALDASLDLTGEALTALDASAGVAADTVESLGTSLAVLETTATDLDVAFDDGEALMRELADLVRDDIAESVGAVDSALPGLTATAGTIETTLSALSALPVGPDYDPEQRFTDSLEDLSSSLDGLPDRLEEQADLIDETAGSLSDVGAGVGGLAVELASFDETLSDTAALLGTYDSTIAEGRDLVAEAGDDLASQLVVGRVAVVLLALAFVGLQVVPLQMAALARREAVARLAARVAAEDAPTP